MSQITNNQNHVLSCTHQTKNGQELTIVKLDDGRFRCRHCGEILNIRMSQLYATPKTRIRISDKIQQAKSEMLKIQKDDELGYGIFVKIPKKMAELLQANWDKKRFVERVGYLVQDIRGIKIPNWMTILDSRLYGLDRNIPYVNMTIVIPYEVRRSINCSWTPLANRTIVALWCMLSDDEQAIINDIYLNSENFMYLVKQSYHYRSMDEYENITLDEWFVQASQNAILQNYAVKERSVPK